MAKRKTRGQSSLFASLPQELRQTITSSLATTAPVAIPPALASQAVPVAEEPRASKSLKRNASEVVGEEEASVVVKRRRPWSEEDERRGRRHPWDCEGLVPRYDRAKGVPLELRKCESLRSGL